MKTTHRGRTRFVICIQNPECDDLQIGKVYRALPDRKAGAAHLLRVVDDSGEDYLYPASYFVSLELPPRAVRALGAARRRASTQSV